MGRARCCLQGAFIFAIVIGLTSADWFTIRLDSKTGCNYEGYAPGGRVKKVDQIEAPIAELAEGGLNAALGGLVQASHVSSATANAVGEFVEKYAKVAPKLGASLGLFGAAFGFLDSLGKPSLSDVMKSVNTAIQDLTDEMNEKLDQMKGYVDTRVINSERDMLQKQYRSSFEFWKNCIREYTAAEADECQMDAAKLLVSSRALYTTSPEKVLEKETISSYERRQLEANLVLFRDYANLVILELTPLIDHHCENSKRDARSRALCQRFSEDLHNEVNMYITYVDNAVKLIQQSHGTHGVCLTTFSCGAQHEIKEGGWVKKHTANWFECKCVIEDSNSKQYCKVHGTIRTDGKKVYTRYNYPNQHGYAAGSGEFGNRILWEASRVYQSKNGPVVKTYWQKNVLNIIPTWRKALKKAEFGMNLRDEEEDDTEVLDAEPLAWYSYSARFAARKKKAGFI